MDRSSNSPGKISVRNPLIESQMVIIDLNYESFVNRITANRQNFDSGTDIAEIGVNLAPTIVGGAAAKTVLGAVSTAISGAKQSIDKNYFYEKTVPVLVTVMNGYRNEVKARILSGMKSPDSDYGLGAAVSDIREYYYAGTFVGALAKMQQDAGTKASAAEARLQQVMNSSTSSASLNLLMSHFDVADANQKKSQGARAQESVAGLWRV